MTTKVMEPEKLKYVIAKLVERNIPFSWDGGYEITTDMHQYVDSIRSSMPNDSTASLSRCPTCNSTHVAFDGELEQFGDLSWVDTKCLNCGSTYDDAFWHVARTNVIKEDE